MNRQFRIFHRTIPILLGITLCFSPFNTIVSGDKAIAAEKITSTISSKIQPNHWAYQFIKSLNDRYDCAADYKTLINTLHSNQPMDRYEIAAMINSCLEQIGNHFITSNDREMIQKLQTEFKPELAKIKSRNDSLEAREKEIEQQNPRTTKVIVDRVLPDVSPAQWNTVRSLIVKYRCISGDSDDLFHPDRPTTRYELAAALNACLRRNNNHFATRQDRELAENLEQEFKTELAEIRNRTNGLEARAANLEFKQFSPTSKLQGQTVITIQGGGF